MKIKVSVGGSQRDKGALHFSYWTLFGLGHQRTIAIYFPTTNILEASPRCAKLLPKILKALRKYINGFPYGSLDFGHEPMLVKYW